MLPRHLVSVYVQVCEEPKSNPGPLSGGYSVRPVIAPVRRAST
jgi:hypothetical protein